MIPVSDSLYLVVHTVVGGILTLGSALLLVPVLQFLRSRRSPMSLDSVGHYFVCFAGVLNLVWGLALLATRGDAEVARLLAAPSAVGFALMSLFRIPFSRDETIVKELGRAPRFEVFVFGVAALFFGAAALDGCA